MNSYIHSLTPLLTHSVKYLLKDSRLLQKFYRPWSEPDIGFNPSSTTFQLYDTELILLNFLGLNFNISKIKLSIPTLKG